MSKNINRRFVAGKKVDETCKGIGCPLADGCGRHKEDGKHECRGRRNTEKMGMWECEAFIHPCELKRDEWKR